MKIPLEYEDYIDRNFYSWSDKLSPSFKTCGFTPNWITTLSLVCTIVMIYLILQQKCEWAAALYVLSYFFDCMDGHFARKYKMTSKFGDYYDHIADWIRNSAALFIILFSCSCKNTAIPIITLIILFVLGNIKQAYQDKYYKLNTGRNETESLNFIERFIAPPNSIQELDDGLKKLKYIGWGTFSIAAAAFLATCGDTGFDASAMWQTIKNKFTVA